MKWRTCKKGGTWNRYDAWVGRKNGWSIEISSAGRMHPKNKYYFLAERTKGGGVYNSLWDFEPYPSVEFAQIEAEKWALENR